MNEYMSKNASQLVSLLENLSEQFREVRGGLVRAHRISAEDPEMALARVRKVLEYVIREVYERRIREPAGTRPLENLIQRLQKDGYLPERVTAYASAVRILGNAGVHGFAGDVTTADVYHALSLLTPVLDWYCKNERPDAVVRARKPREWSDLSPDDLEMMMMDSAPVRPLGLRNDPPPIEIEAYARSQGAGGGESQDGRAEPSAPADRARQ
jgi:hypothetical protein